MRKTVHPVCIASLFLASLLFSQENHPGRIGPELVKKLRSGTGEGGVRALINAVSENDVQKLVKSQARLGELDTHFAVKVDVPGITNQYSTGRCWLFTGLNVLRPGVMRKYNLKKFEFSENYSFFWDQFEKANLFLEGVIETRAQEMNDRKVEWLFQNPVGDGGVWSMMVDIVEKYGVVPAEIMPETFHSKNTGDMRTVLRTKLRECGLVLRRMHREKKSVNELRKAKEGMMAEVYRILAMHFGEPPVEFTWRFEDKDGKVGKRATYTPQTFYKEAVDAALSDYIMLMNDPTRDYHRLYEIEYDRNMVEGRNWTYVNLPVETLKKYAKKSLLSGEPLYFSCDVGKQLDRESGILSMKNYDYESLYGISFSMTKKDRIQTFESGSTHGMSLVGVDTSDTGAPVKWLLENSWGSGAGFNGFLIMTDEWFDEFSFRLVVHKRFVDEEVLAVLKQKPVKLLPWDPMFLPFEDQ